MATLATLKASMVRGGFPALGPKVGLVEVRIDLPTASQALVADGEGELATGDIIQAFDLPQGTVVLQAGIEITETVVGVAALPVGLGVTGGDVDQFVTEVDIGASSSYVLTDLLPPNAVGGTLVVGDGAAGATSDTIDLLFGTVSATSITAGALRVWAVVIDANDLTG